MITGKSIHSFIHKIKPAPKTDVYFFLASFFILAFLYFYWFSDYLLFFQEKQFLFVFSGDFIREYLLKPGGPIELTGKFLTQFYSNTILGSLILSSVLTLPGYILFRINKRLIPGTNLSLLFLLIPSCLLLLMQTHYYHMMEYNLGFILVFLHLLLSILAEKKNARFLVIIMFPLFYYLAGAYAWIYLGIYVIYKLTYEKGMQRFYSCLFLTVTAIISLVVFWKIIFLEPWEQLFLFPLPFINAPAHEIIFHILPPFIILYPLLYKITGFTRIRRLYTRVLTLILCLILFSATIFMVSKLYNPQTARVIQLEKLVFEERWNETIDLQENFPSRNQIGQYFYNIALSETDQLCDRLFYGEQDFGTSALILPWSNEHLSWGAYFFYSIGLVNEAHRWAYEEMVVHGCRPQNIKLLVKTNIVNGDYKMALKYINILKKTIYYKEWAIEYEKLLQDPQSIRLHPDLGPKMKIIPKNNFFIQIDAPQINLALLLDSNPNNRKAFEYEMSWFLLTKNVEAVVNNVKSMKEMGYTSIPRHIEEAVLLYYNSTKVVPDLGGLMISFETQARFDQYVSAYLAARQNPATSQGIMKQGFSNTYWFYFHFNQGDLSL